MRRMSLSIDLGTPTTLRGGRVRLTMLQQASMLECSGRATSNHVHCNVHLPGAQPTTGFARPTPHEATIYPQQGGTRTCT